MFSQDYSSTNDEIVSLYDRLALMQSALQTLNFASSPDGSEQRLLQHILLDGTLTRRTVFRPLQETLMRVVLYFRSPRPTSDGSNGTHAARNDWNDGAHASLWPFTTCPQCVWLQLYPTHMTPDNHVTPDTVPHELPGLALVSVLWRETDAPSRGLGVQMVDSVVAHDIGAGRVPALDSAGARGTVVVVGVEGRASPIAVGWCENETIAIVQSYRDDLWRQCWYPHRSAAARMNPAKRLDHGHHGCGGPEDGPLSQHSDAMSRGEAIRNVGPLPKYSDTRYTETTVTCHTDGDEMDGAPPSRSDTPSTLSRNGSGASLDALCGAYLGHVDTTDNNLVAGFVSLEPSEDWDASIGRVGTIVDGMGHVGRVGLKGNDASPTKHSKATRNGAVADKVTHSSPEEHLHWAFCSELLLLSAFPVNVPTFFHGLVQKYRIDLKQTKYVKLGVYLAEQVHTGLITTARNDKNNDRFGLLTGYNPNHCDLIQLRDCEFPVPSDARASSGAGVRDVLVHSSLGDGTTARSTAAPLQPVARNNTALYDNALHEAFCTALLSLQHDSLPLNIPTFFNRIVHERTIDMKQTKYKKLGAYLAEQIEAGLVTTSRNKKNNDAFGFLTWFDPNHNDLVKLRGAIPKLDRVETTAGEDAVGCSVDRCREHDGVADAELSLHRLQSLIRGDARPSPDSMLHEAFCRALLALGPQSLPLNVATFFHRLLVQNVGLDVKQTRYKRLGAYLAEQVATGLIATARNDKTNDTFGFLTSYDPDHIDLARLRGTNTNRSENKKESSRPYCYTTDGADTTPMPSLEESLHDAVCVALLLLNPDDFPITMATFYGVHVRKFCSLDLKLTKYKKFSVYVAEKAREGLITTAPIKNNTDTTGILTGYNLAHSDLVKHRHSENAVSDNATATISNFSKKSIFDVLKARPFATVDCGQAFVEAKSDDVSPTVALNHIPTSFIQELSAGLVSVGETREGIPLAPPTNEPSILMEDEVWFDAVCLE